MFGRYMEKVNQNDRNLIVKFGNQSFIQVWENLLKAKTFV